MSSREEGDRKGRVQFKIAPQGRPERRDIWVSGEEIFAVERTRAKLLWWAHLAHQREKKENNILNKGNNTYTYR